VSDDPFWIPDKKPEPPKRIERDDLWLPDDWEPPYDPNIRVFKNYVLLGSKRHRIERDENVSQADFIKHWLTIRKILAKRGSMTSIKRLIDKQARAPMDAFRKMAGISEDDGEEF
jgi:hypothetical protein